VTDQSSNDDKGRVDRREFLIGAAACAASLSSCSGSEKITRDIPTRLSARQLAFKRQGRSQVAIVPVANYEMDIFEELKKTLTDSGFRWPDFKGKKVVLKPNMVEYRQGKPVTTNPAVLKAAIQLLAYLGAGDIKVAEGPGHMRDTEYLLDVTGLGKACSDMKVPFIDLNLDDIVKLDNADGFTGMKHFYLPKTIVEADAVISLPKLKTHHWVGMTCSMKNLFGTVPGRKYGWPKNLLHIKGIPHSIIDLQHLIKPAMGIVDGIVTMEGDGPINGTAKHLGQIILGDDLAAVDATCARILALNPEELNYIKLAGMCVGNIDLESIDIIGTPVSQIAGKYKMPITFTNKDLLKQAAQQGS
jgi:uncharacterized protein (DUF362 family)